MHLRPPTPASSTTERPPRLGQGVRSDFLCLATPWPFTALLQAPFLTNFAVGFAVGVHNGALAARGGPVWRLTPLATTVDSAAARQFARFGTLLIAC